jgi:hypothetical protein
MTNRLLLQFLVAAVATTAVAGAFLLDPIPQDPAYHAFADDSRLFGIPNFWNVATNLPFLFIGLVGLAQTHRLSDATLGLHHRVFCIGVALVALGSAYYHFDPSTPALVWDRLPMTIAFMALFAAVLTDRVSAPLGRALLWPLIAAGIASIAWWIRTEMAGQGDLRPYAIVQFLPMLLVPLILLLSRGGSLNSAMLWMSLGAYGAAKLAEHFDPVILDATGVFSGHSLKHLFAALGAWWAIRAFQKSPARDL